MTAQRQLQQMDMHARSEIAGKAPVDLRIAHEWEGGIVSDVVHGCERRQVIRCGVQCICLIHHNVNLQKQDGSWIHRQ